MKILTPKAVYLEDSHLWESGWGHGLKQDCLTDSDTAAEYLRLPYPAQTSLLCISK